MSNVEARLETLAQTIGVNVVESNKLGSFLNACFHKSTQTIIVRRSLDPATRKCAIAHELGHAHYGHDCSSPRTKREADESAARLLVDYHNMEQIAYEFGWPPPEICAELGVTPVLFEVWNRLYAAGKIDVNDWCQIY